MAIHQLSNSKPKNNMFTPETWPNIFQEGAAVAPLRGFFVLDAAGAWAAQRGDGGLRSGGSAAHGARAAAKASETRTSERAVGLRRLPSVFGLFFFGSIYIYIYIYINP